MIQAQLGWLWLAARCSSLGTLGIGVICSHLAGQDATGFRLWHYRRDHQVRDPARGDPRCLSRQGVAPEPRQPRRGSIAEYGGHASCVATLAEEGRRARRRGKGRKAKQSKGKGRDGWVSGWGMQQGVMNVLVRRYGCRDMNGQSSTHRRFIIIVCKDKVPCSEWLAPLVTPIQLCVARGAPTGQSFAVSVIQGRRCNPPCPPSS